MAGPASQDQYNPTPSVAPSTGMPSDYLNVRSNPNEFGAQVGEAVQSAGAKVQQLGDTAVNLAIQRQGLINETLATHANLDLAVRNGDEFSKFTALKGLDAYAAKDTTINTIMSNYEATRANLPSDAARRAFDQEATFRLSRTIQDIDGHAGTQLKAANSQGYQATMELAKNDLADPKIASDPYQVGMRVGQIKSGMALIMQNDEGYANVMHQDGKTGQIIFDDTPQGEQAKAVYNNAINKELDGAYQTAAKTLASDPQYGVTVAMQFIKDNKDKMPATTYADLNYKFNQSFKNQTIDLATNDILSKASSDYANNMSQYVSGKPPIDNLFSAIKGQEGGPDSNVMQIKDKNLWSKYATTDQNIDNPNDNTDVGRKILTDYYHKYGDWQRAAVAYFSGEGNVAPAGSPTPYKDNDPVFSGKHISETNNGKTVSQYVADIGERLGGGQGGYYSQATYLQQHSQEILQNTANFADANHYDPVMKESLLTKVETQINRQVHNQQMFQYAQRDSLYSYIIDNNISDINEVYGPNAPPETKQAWNHLNGLEQAAVEKFVLSQSGGKQQNLGTDFWNHFSTVLNGKNTDYTTYGQYTGSSTYAPITNTGMDYIKSFSDNSKTPQGVAFNNSMYQFLQKAHNVISGSQNGVVNGDGEIRFEQFLREVIPDIKANMKDGSSIFNGTNPNYVGKLISHYTPNITQLTNEAVKTGNAAIMNQSAATTLYKSIDDLKQAISEKKLTPEQALEIGVTQKLIQPKAPPVPMPQ